MVVSIKAEEALALWELAMKEQRAAERQLQAAQRSNSARSIRLYRHVEAARTRADLLLAKAVETMRDTSSEID